MFSFHHHFIKPLLILTVAWFYIGESADAQIDPSLRANPALGIPVPKGVKASAIKGNATTITLTSEVKSPSSVVEFILRDPPEYGTLGAIVSKPGNRSQATVVYTSVLNAPPKDSFTFTVRYRDPSGRNGLFSPKETVEITLKDSAPSIVAPIKVTFDRTMMGKESVRDLYLRNVGNAPYSQKVQLSPPWHFVKPANGVLSIPSGAGLSVKIAYRPTLPGKTKLDLQFHASERGTSQLEADAFAPFKLMTREATLKYDPKSRVRAAEIPVLCFASQPITLQLEPPPRTLATSGDTLTLLPGQTDRQITLYLPATDVRPFSGELKLKIGGYEQAVSLNAKATPAHLLINTLSSDNGSLNFGELKLGTSAQRAIILQNVGGQLTNAKLQIDEPFQIIDGATAGQLVVVPAEGNHQLVIGLAASEKNGGLFRNKLLITTAEQKIEIDLNAYVETPEPVAYVPLPRADEIAKGAQNKDGASAEAQLPPNLMEMTVETMEKLRSPSGFIAIDGLHREYSDSIPPVTEVQVSGIGKTSIELKWKIPGPGQEDYEIDMLGWKPGGNQMLTSGWYPYQDITYKIKDEEVTATVSGLSTFTTYEMRILTLGPTGRTSNPVVLLPIRTLKPMDWTWIYVGFFALLLTGLIWIGRALYIEFFQLKIPGNYD